MSLANAKDSMTEAYESAAKDYFAINERVRDVVGPPRVVVLEVPFWMAAWVLVFAPAPVMIPFALGVVAAMFMAWHGFRSGLLDALSQAKDHSVSPVKEFRRFELGFVVIWFLLMGTLFAHSAGFYHF